ncbi:hypothetical protein SUGI_0805460 [Cryptomeria japonica]|nr:hypothetical protein SUGI_0805460 [Cryptomeria japonica]
MRYYREMLALALILALVLQMGRPGTCSRTMFHMKNPHSSKLNKAGVAAEVSSVGSNTIPLKNCRKLCRFTSFYTMLAKGPVPPSGPSPGHNSVPGNR